MPTPNTTQPVSAADKAARRAYRSILYRQGADQLAALLGIARRTAERIGVLRDVPPGIAMDLARHLLAAEPDGLTAGSVQSRCFVAFSAWAEECRQRSEARHHG